MSDVKKSNKNFDSHFEVVIKEKQAFEFEKGKKTLIITKDPHKAIEEAKKYNLQEDEIIRIKLLDGREIRIEDLEEYLKVNNL